MELQKARHVQYFQRCYTTVLPSVYTSMDSNRLLLGYFTLAGLDLLINQRRQYTRPSQSLIPAADRQRLRDWVLAQQHRKGGFCGSPGHVQPDIIKRGWNEAVSYPAVNDTENVSLPGTYFALLTLGLLANEDANSVATAFRGVNRIGTLRWIKRLQRPDGSFGEVVNADGSISGGRDMRYCYMAATIRWVLRGNEVGKDLDIDIDGMVRHIRKSQAYDGGFAESHMGESQAGYAYCAVAALSMLDLTAADANKPNRYLEAGIPNIAAMVRWLVSRQIVFTDSDESDSEEEAEDKMTAVPTSEMASLSVTGPVLGGFNGRPNKVADTCYAWWVAGALHVLNDALPEAASLNGASGREFLLQKTQNAYGGFGKDAGAPPDLFHSYLGLAALATMAGNKTEEGLGQFDVRLCLGKEAASRVDRARQFWAPASGNDTTYA
ncbi:type-1 proteins geranylgeranyltransferase subunit beta [Apiospora phragmitis]|uniref:Type-1 proteins geranylgeranyltransferase subunit beta n=1 Tax=Apiospora phragmitis TaxID=2905665 RepID=A0ABR1TTV6_9PEZI